MRRGSQKKRRSHGYEPTSRRSSRRQSGAKKGLSAAQAKMKRERTLASVDDSAGEESSSEFDTDDEERRFLEDFDIEDLEDDMDDWFETEMAMPTSQSGRELDGSCAVDNPFHRRINSQLKTQALFAELRDRQRAMLPGSAPSRFDFPASSAAGGIGSGSVMTPAAASSGIGSAGTSSGPSSDSIIGVVGSPGLSKSNFAGTSHLSSKSSGIVAGVGSGVSGQRRNMELPRDFQAEMDQWLIAIDENNDDYEFFTAEEALALDVSAATSAVTPGGPSSVSSAMIPSSPALQKGVYSNESMVHRSGQDGRLEVVISEHGRGPAGHGHKASQLVVVDLEAVRSKKKSSNGVDSSKKGTKTVPLAAAAGDSGDIPARRVGWDSSVRDVTVSSAVTPSAQAYGSPGFEPSYFTDGGKHRSRQSNFSFIPQLRKRKTVGTSTVTDKPQNSNNLSDSTQSVADEVRKSKHESAVSQSSNNNDGGSGGNNGGSSLFYSPLRPGRREKTLGHSVDFGLPARNGIGGKSVVSVAHTEDLDYSPHKANAAVRTSYVKSDRSQHREPMMVDESQLDLFTRLYRIYYDIAKNTVAGIMLQRMADRGSFVFDVSTDVTVFYEFWRNGDVFWSMIVFSSLLMPYIVCWSAGFRVVNELKWDTFGQLMYLIPFTGIPILMLLDSLMIVEAFILNPLFWLLGYYIREPSREEYGYLRLRAMAELFLENIPQVGLQFYIWAFRGGAHGLNQQTIALSVTSAVVNILIMCYYLWYEADINHMAFMEYAILSMQGRFGFTPFVDRIAQGLVRYVDYTVDETGALYFNSEALRKLVAALQNKKCRLRDLVMGKSCRPIRGSEEQLLWQLYDVCARKYIRLSEERTSNYVRYQGETIMRLACTQGYDGVLRKLLRRQPACDPDDTDEDGLTALMLACKFSHFTLARQLLSTIDAKRCHRQISNVNLQDNHGKSAVMYACDQEIIDDDLVRLLLSRDQADPNIQDKMGMSCLMLAATRGGRYGTRAVRTILAFGQNVDVNLADFSGMTPLMIAASKGHTAIVKMLCRVRSDRTRVDPHSNAHRNSMNAHHSKSNNGNNKGGGGKYLIDVNQTDTLGRTAFHWACIQGRDEVVDYFLRLPGQRKVDLNKCSSKIDYYTTPLMFACIWDHVKVIELLLQNDRIRLKLNINAKDKKNRTALFHCCRSERVESLRLLLFKDIRLDSQICDTYGHTAFDVANVHCRTLLNIFFGNELIPLLDDHLKLTPLFMIEDLRYYFFLSKDNDRYLDGRHIGLIWQLLIVYQFHTEWLKFLFDQLGSVALVYQRSLMVAPENDPLLLNNFHGDDDVIHVDDHSGNNNHGNGVRSRSVSGAAAKNDHRRHSHRNNGDHNDDDDEDSSSSNSSSSDSDSSTDDDDSSDDNSDSDGSSDDSSSSSASSSSSDGGSSSSSDSSDSSSDDDSDRSKKNKKQSWKKRPSKSMKTTKKKKPKKRKSTSKKKRRKSQKKRDRSATTSPRVSKDKESEKRRSGFLSKITGGQRRHSEQHKQQAARVAALSVESTRSRSRSAQQNRSQYSSYVSRSSGAGSSIRVTYVDTSAMSDHRKSTELLETAAAMDSGGVAATKVVDLEPSSSDDESSE